MARHTTHFIFALLIASCALAQPVINSSAVVNSASFLYQGNQGSGIAQGSIFSIFGSGLGPDIGVGSGPLPLQTSLGGTSVTVTVGGQTAKAYIIFTVGGQVNALLPSATPTGSGTVTVTYNNRTSQPEPVQIVAASFGTYTFGSYGRQASATDLSGNSNTIINTFHPGDWVILWGTGLGAINGDDSKTPPVGNLGSPTVHVGTASLTPPYAGRSAQYPGLDQVQFQIPSGIQGCYVPVAVETNGVVSNSPTIAISASGQTCSDSLLGQDLINKLAAGDKVDFGFVQLSAIILRYPPLPAGIAAPDFVKATFSEFTPQTAGLAAYGVSQGYCISGNNDPDGSPGQLDAGAAITLQGPSIATLPQLSPGWGYYYSLFNNGAQFFFSDLSYSVSGTGGAKVGPFSVNDTSSIPSAYFSGITAGQTFPRSADLTVTWTGGDPTLQNGQVTIAGFSAGTETGSIGGAFICTAGLAAKSFTIPKWVLSTLPPTATGHIGIAPYPIGYIWIGQFNTPVTFQAPGLDKGILMDEFFNGYPVYFQ
jgi:uncharacterized protein (TIGR03437 family)